MKSKPRKTGIIIGPKKNQENLSPGFLLFSDYNNFFFFFLSFPSEVSKNKPTTQRYPNSELFYPVFALHRLLLRARVNRISHWRQMKR